MVKKHNKNKIADLHHYLSGLPFPASREEIIEYVRDKGAPTGMLDIANNLERKTYQNETEILAMLGFETDFPRRQGRKNIPDLTRIPKQLPRFDTDPVLIIVAGRQAAVFYRVHRGTMAPILSHKIPTPHYSDNEGHFKVRSGGGVIRSGAVKELRDETTIIRDFLMDLKNIMKQRLHPKEYEKVFIFMPCQVKKWFIKSMPKVLSQKIDHVIEGNYLKHRPLELLAKIAERDAVTTLPSKPEARKIIQKSEQAQAVIKGKFRE